MPEIQVDREIKGRLRGTPSKRAVQDENVALRKLCHRMLDLLALKLDPRWPVTEHDRVLLKDMQTRLETIKNTTI
jgi:hypothetical protein